MKLKSQSIFQVKSICLVLTLLPSSLRVPPLSLPCLSLASPCPIHSRYEVEYREEHKYGEPEEWEKQTTQPTDIGERTEKRRRRRRSIHTVVCCVSGVCDACAVYYC